MTDISCSCAYVRSSAEEWDLIARRVGNAREVRSGRRAEPCPPARAGAWPRSLPCCPVPCRAQTVGLDHRPVGRVGPGEPSAPGNAAHARRSGPSHHGCLQILGLDGPVSVTGRRVKPYSQSGHGHAGVLGHHGGAGGRFKSAAPALRLLAFWVERWVVPPAPHVNITKFEDSN